MRTLVANYAWYELVGPITLVFVAVLSYWYIKTIIQSPEYKPTTKQKSYFFIAIGLFFIVKGTPFALVAENYLVSALILQLSIISFVVTPLFILSLPSQFLKVFFWRHRRAKLAKMVMKYPWPLAIIFNVLITIYLVPPIFNLITESALLQLFYEIVLITFAFLTWWVIIQPLQQLAEHSYFKRGVYVFLMALFLMPVAIFLIVGQSPMYTSYIAGAADLFPSLTAVSDQQLAGGFLKLLQLSSYSTALYYLLKIWGLEEEANEGKVDDDTRVVQGVVIKLNERNRRNRGK